jgi:2-keto-4-pentenoate hydratase/2-oxohepta-3-ene-1,7-dioic acid hydratase in catechol pathway
MRLVKFNAAGLTRVGVLQNGSIDELPVSWRELLERVTGRGGRAGLPPAERTWAVEQCVLKAPLSDDGRPIFCLGLNYIDHEAEVGNTLGVQRPASPVVFAKQPEAMADPNEELLLDAALSKEFDWEVELAVIIGRGGRDIDPTRVADHIAGYSVLNDVTARDAQREHVQWFLGKNVHRSSPMGPWVTTADEIEYPPDLWLALSVNSVEKQRARTSELIFDVACIVSTVSRYVELQVGDVFATGTPAGVGFTRRPAEFLTSGDVMVAEIENIGALQNRVR